MNCKSRNQRLSVPKWVVGGNVQRSASVTTSGGSQWESWTPAEGHSHTCRIFFKNQSTIAIKASIGGMWRDCQQGKQQTFLEISTMYGHDWFQQGSLKKIVATLNWTLMLSLLATWRRWSVVCYMGWVCCFSMFSVLNFGFLVFPAFTFSPVITQSPDSNYKYTICGLNMPI